MNILGHPYVAYKVTGKLTSDLIAGSHIPDLVPFVPNSVFSFAEIHEEGDFLYKFLKENYPEKLDLALGMMSHSVKFGADRFNNEIEEWLLGDNEEKKDELAQKIASCSNVSFQIARQARIHNYLWTGVDVYLQRQKKSFVSEIVELHRAIDWEDISLVLSEAYGKRIGGIRRMIEFMVKPIKPEYLLTLSGLVKIWKSALAGLPEKDEVKEAQTKKLFEEIYFLFEDRWEGILEKVVKDTRTRMSAFLF